MSELTRAAKKFKQLRDKQKSRRIQNMRFITGELIEPKATKGFGSRSPANDAKKRI